MTDIQLIIQPVPPLAGDNFLIPTSTSARVSEVVAAAASKIGAVNRVHLLKDGLPLDNNLTVEACGLGSLSTVSLQEAAPEHDDLLNPDANGQTVTEDELHACVIVSDIPQASAVDTEAATLAVFGAYGTIRRALYQTAENNLQQAVIVFAAPEEAQAAIAANDQTILGHPIHVILAAELPDPAAPGHAAGGGSPAPYVHGGAAPAPGMEAGGGDVEPRSGSSANKKVAAFLASGMVVGHKGLARVGKFDQEHFRLREKAAALAKATGQKVKELDERLRISQRTEAGLQTVTRSINNVDQRYGISEKAQRIGDQANREFSKARESVMRNPKVASGVAKVSSFFGRAQTKVSDTLTEAQHNYQSEIRTDADGGRPLPATPAAAPHFATASTASTDTGTTATTATTPQATEAGTEPMTAPSGKAVP